MTALLILMGVLLIASGAGKKKTTTERGRPPPGPEVPIGPGSEKFEDIGGFLAYKRAEAINLIASLYYRVATPTEEPNMVVVTPGDGRVMGPLEFGAYYGLQALHDQGNTLWVPLSFHWPETAMIGQFVIYLPPGEAPPPDYAILILADEPWPAVPYPTF